MLPTEDEISKIKEKVDDISPISPEEFEKLVKVLLDRDDVKRKEDVCLILSNIAKRIGPLPDYIIPELGKCLSRKTWQAAEAFENIATYQKQKLPMATLEKLGELWLDNEAHKYTSKCAISALVQAAVNGQKIWESELILTNINNALEDFKEAIPSNALHILNKIKEEDESRKKFRSLYKSFDSDFIERQLRLECQKNKSFHLQMAKEFRYITRKYSITSIDLSALCTAIRNVKDTDPQTRLCLSQSVRHLIQQDYNVAFDELIDILKTDDRGDVRSEMACALAYKIKNCKELVEKRTIEEIKACTNEGINSEAKKLLDSEIRNQLNTGDARKGNIEKIKVSNKCSRKAPRATVTKSQQKVKEKYKNSQSEEAVIHILSLAGALKKRNKNIKIKSQVENLPLVPEKSGTDRLIWKTSYDSVKNLYRRAMNNLDLRSDDKDNYLPDKFMNTGFYGKWFASDLDDIVIGKSMYGNFKTDRLISATFCKISERQQLNCKALNKLDLCIDSLDKVKKLVLRKLDPKAIATDIIECRGLLNKRHHNKPDILANIANALYKVGLNQDQTNAVDRINEIMSCEISGMRLDAIQALYNCAVRDKEVLTKERFDKLQKCLSDPDVKFQGEIIKTLSLVDTEFVDYKALFSLHMSALEDNRNTEIAIGYVNDQAKDANRCQELFDEQTILKLSKALMHNFLDDETKAHCCEIINNYLEHSFSKGLTFEALRNCSCIIEDEERSKELKAKVLMSILLTAEKDKDLPEDIADCLVRNMDDKTGRFVILSLGSICEKTKIKNLDSLSNYLLDDTVVVGEGYDITFEKRSKDNSTSISSITGLIFVNSLQKGSKITETSLDHLVSALDSDERQTRISSAKALYLASSRGDEISELILIKIREHVNDSVADVASYTTFAYTEGLNKLVQNKVSISPSHLGFLASVYAFENLILGEDLTKKVNSNIMSILLEEANEQEFEESVFSIFEYILFTDQDNQREVVIILDKYTARYRIPDNTIVALENALGIPDVCDHVLKVLEKLIRKGQIVSERTLGIYGDNLYLEEGDSVRLKSFELLDIANDNQYLTDELFDKLELQRAGNVIIKHQDDTEKAICYLKKKTEDGQRLPIDTLKALTCDLGNKQVLSIVSHISKNKQVLPNDLINNLVEELDPKQAHIELVEIFRNIAQNNQNISTELLRKLEEALDDEKVSDQVLSIFAIQGLKGENVSNNVINRMCQRFLTSDSEQVKQELSFAISSIIEGNTITETLVKEVLINGIAQKSESIVENCIKGFRSLSIKISLDKETINALVEKAVGLNFRDHLRKSIFSILDSCSLDNDQTIKLELGKIDGTFKDLLNAMSRLSKQSPLLEKSFMQLNSVIIDAESDLKLQAIQIVEGCLNKGDAPDELLSSIAILSASTVANEIKTSGFKLIGQIAAIGRKLNDEIICLLTREENPGLVQHTLKLIAKNQEIPMKSGLLLRLYSLDPSIGKEDLSKLLKDIYEELAKGLLLTDAAVKILIDQSSMQRNGSRCNLEGFSNVFAHILQQKPQYCSNKTIVRSIEQALLDNNVNINIIKGYQKIIKAKSYMNLDEIMDHFAQCLQGGTESEIANVAMRKCMSSAAEEAAKEPQMDLNRESLLVGLLNRFKTNNEEQMSFYKKWLGVEQSQQFQIKPEEILQALMTNEDNANLSFGQLNDVLTFLPKINRETATHIVLNSSNSYIDLKKEWIATLVSERLEQQIDNSYLGTLASDICDKFNTALVDKLLNSITSIKGDVRDLKEFKRLLEFAEVNHLKPCDITIESASVNEMQRSVELRTLCNQTLGLVDHLKLAGTLRNLLDTGWIFDQLNTILEKIKSLNVRERSLIFVFEVLDQYKIGQVSYKNVLDTVSQMPEGCWLKGMNKIAVENNFQATGRVKNKNELMTELKDMNSDNESILELFEGRSLSELMDKIKGIYLESDTYFSSGLYAKVVNEISDSILPTSGVNKKGCKRSPFISEWNKTDIESWAGIIRSKPDRHESHDFITEALAVIKRANFLHTSFHMTDAQILCCLVSLHGNKNSGRLLQVATGEGKSTIASVLAIINGLKGKKVDIITSSPVLAERDAKEKAGFYKMFRLSCADNNDKSLYIKGPKDCYKKDIVYGEASQFQFDILRDEYSLLGTLANRKCEMAIVDEVDSMLIDDASKTARLSSTIAGMDLLQPIYHYIWLRLVSLQENLTEINGRMYLLYDNIGYEQGKMMLKYADDKGDIENDSDLKEYIRSNEDISHIGQPIKADIEPVLQKHLKDYVKELIDKNIVKVPSNFKEFVERQTAKWVNNAIVALSYQENVHYIVHEGVIKPVDYNSTGIVQSCTNWSDGLHQFLQIKHNLKMTSETFTTNFLSNMGYFKRYSTNLVGLTGTLGSEKSKEVLSKVYNVDLINVPSSHSKQYLELPTVIAADESQWVKEILSSVINEAKKGRGTLIICETIHHTKVIKRKLKEKHKAAVIKLYTMNNMNQEKEIEKVNPGEIIIATNLAGRGTDIKTDKIEINGGLHVIVTFMPSNQRVEEQAFGRTARQGKCGTGQMILNAENLKEYGGQLSKAVKGLRNEMEANVLEDYENKELKVIEIKDELFKKFCGLLKEIRQDITIRRGMLTKVVDSLKDVLMNVISSVYETNLLSAIEEQWSMFLCKIDDGEILTEHADKEYEEFRTQIKKDYDNLKVIKNPFYHIAIANDLVVNDSALNNNYDQAMRHFDQAISLDGNFGAAAFVGKAWLLLKGKERTLVTTNERIPNYKQQAIEVFNEALAALYDELASLNAVQSNLSQNRAYIDDSDLSKQLIQKVCILGSYTNSLHTAISTIKKSQRLIDITGIKTYQHHPEDKKKMESGGKINECNTGVLREARCFYGMEKDNKGRINKENKNFNNYEEFEIVLNDLTSREDCGTRDQAIDTISKVFASSAFKEHDKKSSQLFYYSPVLYKGISINLKLVDAERLQPLFNFGIEIKEATKEEAISELEYHMSCLLPESRSGDSCKINLAITLEDERTKNQSNLQIEEAIKIIKEQKNDKARFSLTYPNANKLPKSLEKKILSPNSGLSIEFLGLASDTGHQKMNEVKAERCDLEIKGNKDELERSIEEAGAVKTVQICDVLTNVCVTVNTDEAKERIRRMTEKELNIKMLDLDQTSAREMMYRCQNATFNITFKAIDVKASLKGLKTGQVNISFNKLGQMEANELIAHLRKEKMDFGLGFSNLSEAQVDQIIELGSLEQEDIGNIKFKTLIELFMEETRPIAELSEFASRGIEYLLEIHEKRFIPWRSIVAVGIIAVIQMAAGAALITTGFGSTVGMGLISDGSADIFTALRAAVSRQFTWSDYLKQKAVSLAISAACMGLQGIKEAGIGMKNLVKGVGKEVLEDVGIRVVTNSQSAGKVLVQCGMNLKSLGLKQMIVSIGKAGVREGLNIFADSLSHFALDQHKPRISSLVQQKVNARFCRAHMMSLVRKMYALDKINNSENLKIKIDKIVGETINPEHNFWRRHWDSIGGPLCKGILSDPNYCSHPFSIGMRIAGTLNGIREIALIIDKVHDELLKKLSQIDGETLQTAHMLHSYGHIERKDAGEIAEILKEEYIILITDVYGTTSSYQTSHDESNSTLTERNRLTCCHEYINPLVYEIEKHEYRNYKMPKTPIDKIYFGNHNMYKDQILKFCKSLHETTLSISMVDLSLMMKSVSDVITDQIIRVTEAQLISPWSTFGVGCLTANISNSIQDKLIRNSDLGKQILFEKKKELEKLKADPNSYKEQIEALEKDIQGKQTYAGAINHEAKKYTVAYNQCEIKNSVSGAVEKIPGALDAFNLFKNTLPVALEWIKTSQMTYVAVSLTVACAAFPECELLKKLTLGVSDVVKLVKEGKYDQYENGLSVIRIVVDVVVNVACQFFPESLVSEIRSLGVYMVTLSDTVKYGYDKYEKGDNVAAELMEGLTLTCSIAGRLFVIYKNVIKRKCQWNFKNSEDQEEKNKKHGLHQNQLVGENGLPLSREQYDELARQAIDEATHMFKDNTNPQNQKTYYYNQNLMAVAVVDQNGDIITCYKVETDKFEEVFKKVIDEQNKNGGFNIPDAPTPRNPPVHTVSSHNTKDAKPERSSDELKGFSLYDKESEIGWINRYFGIYTLEALCHILFLRIKDLQIRDNCTRILSGVFINQMQNNISGLAAEVFENNENILLVPLNLDNKHAAALIFEKHSESHNKIMVVTYLDPLNKPMPEALKDLISINLGQAMVDFKQIIGTEQNYANCGPEVIENIVLYLSGCRVSQEQAIELHSKLVENELIGKGNNEKAHLLFEKTRGD